jgi:hypothetical protein
MEKVTLMRKGVRYNLEVFFDAKRAAHDLIDAVLASSEQRIIRGALMIQVRSSVGPPSTNDAGAAKTP